MKLNWLVCGSVVYSTLTGERLKSVSVTNLQLEGRNMANPVPESYIAIGKFQFLYHSNSVYYNIVISGDLSNVIVSWFPLYLLSLSFTPKQIKLIPQWRD